MRRLRRRDRCRRDVLYELRVASGRAPGLIIAGERVCLHCGASNPLDLRERCARCRRPLPAYCFSCYAPILSDKALSCGACAERRWAIGDFADLPCVAEHGAVVRPHRYMATRMKASKVVHQWRCMRCFAEDAVTDAFSHFPRQPMMRP